MLMEMMEVLHQLPPSVSFVPDESVEAWPNEAHRTPTSARTFDKNKHIFPAVAPPLLCVWAEREEGAGAVTRFVF